MPATCCRDLPCSAQVEVGKRLSKQEQLGGVDLERARRVDAADALTAGQLADPGESAYPSAPYVGKRPHRPVPCALPATGKRDPSRCTSRRKQKHARGGRERHGSWSMTKMSAVT